ncbi:MAG: PEP-utilizing enzyme, partial [Candidatus Micrarchaeota archaeon]
ELLESRWHAAAFLFEKGKYELAIGDEERMLEAAIHSTEGILELRGKTAYPGKAIGKAKIVLDARNAPDFKEGDILIAGMTRPEYISLMKKAAAIVTDAGGILCHAAIVARELKKPCVIGTEKATKVFRNGDMIEVDANKGIVKKIK